MVRPYSALAKPVLQAGSGLVLGPVAGYSRLPPNGPRSE